MQLQHVHQYHHHEQRCCRWPRPTTAAKRHHNRARYQHTHSRLSRCHAESGGPSRESDEEGFGLSASSSSAALGVVFTQQHADVSDSLTFPLTVPLLPFPVDEVLLPGSVKTLHLFEARYLSLLDTVLAQPNANKVFGHVIVEQQGDAFGDQAAAFPGAYKGEGFVFVMATLVRIVEVKRSFVGALVRIQAEARAEVTNVVQTDPFFEGRVKPLCDQPIPVQDVGQVAEQVEQLAQTVRDLQNLTQRFKSKQSVSLQQAMYWADRPTLIPSAAVIAGGTSAASIPQQQQQDQPAADTADSIKQEIAAAAAADSSQDEVQLTGGSSSSSLEQPLDAQSVAERAVRLSFAALQGVPQESAKDQLKLLRCCVKAMKTTDTSARLTVVQSHMQNSLNTLAAKCALKSLNLG